MIASQVLIPADRIAARVREMGSQIRSWYADDTVITLVGVLTGSFVFVADLARAVDGPVKVGFVGVQSYAGTTSRGEVTLTQAPTLSVEHHHVVIVEDIVDTGRTVQMLQRTMAGLAPASTRVVSLLDKPSRRQVPVEVDLVGFPIEDHFVVGYGLDYDGMYRNLPHIAVLRGSPGA